MIRRLALMLAVLLVMSCVVARGAEPLTFFGWSDQHVTVKGEADHLFPAIEAMNTLPGKDYPPQIGGKVAQPTFVFGCGDISEWPTAAARDAYNQAITQRLKFPAYDIVGNHDEGGLSPSQTLKNWITQRHGALNYTFDKAGVHFLAVYSAYDESLNNPAQPVSKDALEFIRTNLAKVPNRRPVVVALHLCFDAITNRDDVVTAFGDANVVLVLGGHYHKATLHEYKGFHFVQLPSPQSTTMFTVIRIGPDRVVALPYDYKEKNWARDPRVRLDVGTRK